ncbi:putative RING finger and transmembrane domain-containing protein 2 [Nannochloris sp. 'desiccata']|nr:putative RING finger and transmembrane domain-containing protein 2 [Chlorella desiccata (nom. nud.)]
MEEDEPFSHPVASPRSGPDSAPVATNGESLASLAGRFLSLWSTSSRSRLTLSISEQDQPNVPIISESNVLTDRLESIHNASASLGASPVFQVSSLGSPSTSDTTTTNLGFGALAEAEAGVSRHLTYQDEYSDLAADAERLRLTTSTPISTLDIRQIARSVEKSLPFLLLVLFVFTYHHFKSILLVSFGTFTLYRCNSAIQQQVARRGELNRKKAVSTAVALFFYATIIAAVGLPGGNLLRTLAFRGVPIGYQFWSVLLTIALADTFSRLMMAALKAGIVACARVDSQARCRRRGALLSSLDYCISVHRSMLPAPLWLKYFQNSNLPFLLAMSLSGFYLLAKAGNVLEKLSLAVMEVGKLLGGRHGTVPTAEELAAAPRECAICQEDVRNPLRLICGHIFCSDCVEEWLARESSCPMCRREVRRANLKPKNDGGTSLVPILC